ncbi:MAG TPA: hypothetical protein OIM49_05510 [Clostridiaceae bacterium]|jgi:hypothetical protein|nr:hypothetical protein [Clostridiaceae bacterium]
MDNKDLENEIAKIKERNKRVELDKAWETSWTRKICICILTYIVVVIYSYLINKNNNIWLSSLVPVIGFTLSTVSLNLVRTVWEKNRK